MAIILDIDASLAGKTLAEIKDKVKELQEALGNEAIGGKGFIALTEQLRNAETQVNKVETAIQALKPDSLGQKFTAMGENVVKGLEVAQGAFTLFSAESETLEKLITKTQSGIAAATKVRAVAEELLKVKIFARMAAEKGLSTAIQATTVTTKGFNAAVKANPIGLIITAATTLISIFVALYDKFEVVRNAIDKILAPIKNMTQAVGEFFGMVESEADKAVRKTIENLDALIDKEKELRYLMKTDGDERIRQMALQGATEAELHRERMKVAEEFRDSLYKESEAAFEQFMLTKQLFSGKKELTAEESKLLTEREKLWLSLVAAAYKAEGDVMQIEVDGRKQRVAATQKADDEAAKAKATHNAYKADIDKQLAEARRDGIEDEGARELQALAVNYNEKIESIKGHTAAEEALRLQLTDNFNRDLKALQDKWDAKHLSDQVDKNIKAIDGRRAIAEQELHLLDEKSQAYFDKQLEIENLQFEANLLAYEDKELAEKEHLLNIEAINKEHRDRLQSDQAIKDAAEITAWQRKVDTVISINNSFQTIMSELQKMSGKNTKAALAFEKTAAISQIAVSTAVGIAQGVKAVRAGDPVTFAIQLAANIGAVLAAINQARQAFNKAGDVSAPTFAKADTSSFTSTANALDNASKQAAKRPITFIDSGQTAQRSQAYHTAQAQEQKPVRAYVVERDMTETQNRVSKLQDSSTIR